jgi:hypothetical protein
MNNDSIVIVSESTIQKQIYELRGIRVMLDSDLAALYQIETKNLKRQVRRNISRFPLDFMFELTAEESKALRCQNVTTNNHGGNRYPPMAFTELGVAMLSSVLTSEIAVQVNIAIMRAFSAMKEYLSRQSRMDVEIDSLKARMNLLVEEREMDLASFNDLSEEMRAEICCINQAIADLSVRIEEHKTKPHKKIGFKRRDEKEEAHETAE